MEIVDIKMPLTMATLPDIMEERISRVTYDKDVVVRLSGDVDLLGLQVLMTMRKQAERNKVGFSVEGLPERYKRYFPKKAGAPAV
ncbi:MAG: STAS domain-containing protein [Spirochaetota bacterium]